MVKFICQVSLGGLKDLQENKNRVREANGLPPLPEDPNEVCRQMRASSPPASAADLIEQQIPRRGFRPGPKRVSKFKSPFDHPHYPHIPIQYANFLTFLNVEVVSSQSSQNVLPSIIL